MYFYFFKRTIKSRETNFQLVCVVVSKCCFACGSVCAYDGTKLFCLFNQVTKYENTSFLNISFQPSSLELYLGYVCAVQGILAFSHAAESSQFQSFLFSNPFDPMESAYGIICVE